MRRQFILIEDVGLSRHFELQVIESVCAVALAQLLLQLATQTFIFTPLRKG